MDCIVDVLIYIVYLVLFMLLPGVCFVPQKNKTFIFELIPLAFTFSSAVLIGAYFISFFVKSVLPLFIIPLAFSAVSLLKQRWGSGILDKSRCRVLGRTEVLLFGLMLLYVTCFSVFPNLPVTKSIPKSYHVDQIWHMGNVNMFSNFSMEDIRCSGLSFRYHYFNDVLIASAKLITRISTFNLVFYYFPFTVISVLFLSLKSIANYFLHEKYRLLFVWLVLGSTCASSFLCLVFRYGIFINTLSAHLYTNTNAVASGFVFMLSFVLVLFKNEVYRKESLGLAVLLSAIMVLATGTKGPFGLMLIATTLFAYLVLFLRRKTRCWKVPLLSGISFIMIYLVLLAGGGGGLSFSVGDIIRSTAIFYVIKLFGFADKVNYTLLVLSIPFYFMLLFCGASVFYCVSLFKQAKLFPRNSFQNLFFHGISVVGLALFFAIGHWGNSELYFFFGAIPFIAVLSLQTYQKLEAKKFFRYIFLSGFCIGISSPFFSSLRIIYENRNELRDRVFASKASRMEIRADMLTFEEKEGLEWLKKNSAPSELFITNKLFTDYPHNTDARWFCYSAFSERPCFLEGYGYAITALDKVVLEQKKMLVHSVFNESDRNIKADLLEKGIRFIVECKRQEPICEIALDVAALKFSNSLINIYEVNN